MSDDAAGDPTATAPEQAPEAAPGPAPEQAPAQAMVSRRGVLRRLGLGGLAVGAGWLARDLAPFGPPDAAAAADAGAHAGHGGAPEATTYPDRSLGAGGVSGTELRVEGSHAYGHATAPPAGLSEAALLAVTVPPPAPGGRGGRTIAVELPVVERQLEVGDGVIADAWTYGGTVPGPILRATEGDTLRITMANRTGHPHNVHLHGRHDPAMDGWEPIPPGDSFTYVIRAEPFGLHPYHCHTAPIAEHLGRGLYGTTIVDPPGGRPRAHEFVLVLSGWDLDGDGRNELVCFNGVAGAFHRFPLRVPVGEPIRVYLVNMLEHEPVASFHLHAQTFDVFRSGTALEPHEHTDTVTLAQGERAILEFTLPERGRYMFHPHQSWLADRGAMGWFAAV